jgi:hypothetical protein
MPLALRVPGTAGGSDYTVVYDFVTSLGTERFLIEAGLPASWSCLETSSEIAAEVHPASTNRNVSEDFHFIVFRFCRLTG